MVIDDAKVLQAIADEMERARPENRYVGVRKVIALAQAIDPTWDGRAVLMAMALIKHRHQAQHLERAKLEYGDARRGAAQGRGTPSRS